MTNTSVNLQQARKEYLNALTSLSDTKLLWQQLEDLAAAHPDIFVDYAHDASIDAIDTNTGNWNRNYFSRQKVFAGSNFSRKRIEHLIDVRAHLPASQPSREPAQTASPRQTAVREVAAGYAPATGHTPATGFTPSSNLEKFVERGDLETVRTALRMELNNKSLDTAALMASVNWTKARISGLFEPFQEKAFARGINTDSGQWDSDYFGTQVVYLTTNFSEERFLHLIEVREHYLCKQQTTPPQYQARPAPAPAKPAPVSSSATTSETPRNAAQPPHYTKPQTRGGNSLLHPVALIVGGAMAGIATIIYIIRKYT